MHRRNWSGRDDEPEAQYKAKTTFKALAHLLEANSNYESLEKRIKVKEIIDDRVQHQIKNQEQLLQRVQKAREEHASFEQRKKALIDEQRNHLKDLRIKNIQSKTLHRNKLEEVRKEIQEGRLNEYLNICEQRRSIEKKIERNKENDWFQKKVVRDKVLKGEEIGKDKCQRYMIEKSRAVHRQNIEEIARMTHKLFEKEKQVQSLEKREMDMVARQSQSQASFQQIKNQIETVMGPTKNRLSKHSQEKRSKKDSSKVIGLEKKEQ